MQSRLLRLAVAGLRSAKPAFLDETCLVWFVSQATPVRFRGGNDDGGIVSSSTPMAGVGLYGEMMSADGPPCAPSTPSLSLPRLLTRSHAT